jgi:hypothetical protein
MQSTIIDLTHNGHLTIFFEIKDTILTVSLNPSRFFLKCEIKSSDDFCFYTTMS